MISFSVREKAESGQSESIQSSELALPAVKSAESLPVSSIKRPEQSLQTKLPPIAAQLTAVERENYFGPEARSAFFDYYHHLSRQRFSTISKSAIVRSDENEVELEEERHTDLDQSKLYETGSQKSFKFAEKKYPDQFSPVGHSLKKSTSLDREDTYTWLRVNEERQSEEEKRLVLDHLLSVDSILSNRMSTDRPASARTKFLRGCVDKGILPHPSLIIRKDITTMLNVSSLGIGNEVAILLAEALDSLPLLVGLSIADNNLTDAGLVPIVMKLSLCKNLRLFDLSNNKVDTQTAIALRNFLSSESCNLVVLRMQNANVDDYEAAQFMAAIGVRRTIKELDLCHNLLGSHEFAVNRSKLTAGEAIGQMLKSENCGLKILKLAWNMIRFESAKALVESVQYNQTLIYLDLSYNHLGIEAGEILGNALHSNQTLRALKLAHNNLTARPTLVIFAGVKSCRTLRELDLSENPIGEEGARSLLLLNILEGDRVKTNIKNCSVRITDPNCWFEPFSPKGEYILSLSDFYERAVCFELLNIVARDKDLEIRKCQYQTDQGSWIDLPLKIFVEPLTVRSDSDGKFDELPVEDFHLASDIMAPKDKMSEKVTDTPSNSSTSQFMGRASQQFAENIKGDLNSLREMFRETSNRIFEQYDTDHSGWLDREELAYILEQLV
jgi:Ran GTPase-activating protein (RanGAP) involved in mRNA processing and transport